MIRKNELFYSNFSLSGSSILDGESQNYDIPIISDCTTKSTFLKNITNKYEGSESTASFHQLPKEYVMKLINAIVGFTIEVESFDNVFKLSQNHTTENRKSIEDHLLAWGDEHSIAVAKEMERR